MFHWLSNDAKINLEPYKTVELRRKNVKVPPLPCSPLPTYKTGIHVVCHVDSKYAYLSSSLKHTSLQSQLISSLHPNASDFGTTLLSFTTTLLQFYHYATHFPSRGRMQLKRYHAPAERTQKMAAPFTPTRLAAIF